MFLSVPIHINLVSLSENLFCTRKITMGSFRLVTAAPWILLRGEDPDTVITFDAWLFSLFLLI